MNKMICPNCNGSIVFRFKGGRENDKNFGRRAGVVILKLRCEDCNDLFLCTDNKSSHPYQTKRNTGLVGIYVKIREDQASRLQSQSNQSETVRSALDKYFN